MRPEFMTVRPLYFCACPYGLYGFSLPRKTCPAPSSISVPIKCCTTALKSMPILSKTAAAVLLNFCAHLMLYDLQKSVRYGLFFLVVCCLENRACSLPWDACSPSANVVSLLQLDLSLALSTRMQQQPTMGAPSCPNRPHEGR
jgi:hypothetical protein